MQVCAQNPPSMYITQPKRGSLASKGLWVVVGCREATCWGGLHQQLLGDKTGSLSQPRQPEA